MSQIISSHLHAFPMRGTRVEVPKEDSHDRARGNGNRDVAIHSMRIVARISWAFHCVVDKFRTDLKENRNERKKT